MSAFTMVQAITQPGYVLQVVIDEFDNRLMNLIVERGARIVANRILKEHKAEILAKIDMGTITAKVNEIITEKLDREY